MSAQTDIFFSFHDAQTHLLADWVAGGKREEMCVIAKETKRMKEKRKRKKTDRTDGRMRKGVDCAQPCKQHKKKKKHIFETPVNVI